MPIYEYECEVCGRFEVIQKFSDKALQECPHCKEKGKNTTVQKALSASAFHLKGSGWYKTDYSSGASTGGKTKGAKPSENADSGGDSSSESGSTTTPKKACGTGCGCH